MCASASSSGRPAEAGFVDGTFCRVMPPRDASEAGLALFGREGELGAAECDTSPLWLRERPEDVGVDCPDGCKAEPSSASSTSASDSLSGPRLELRDLLRLALEGLEAMGESGTGCPAAPGELGGGRSGPSIPPMFGTPGSR